ncbi:hypothetical protein K491DRAFT_411974 [Lophiostoma macrostomum CBS 122681]|uniref:Uncharacterized protein n=1 Tax=Lophiostoma macrostomum CBS 122681 TaxID=1314788 RepID=A0A6A6T915_9PLEO|nr:hypothetical protein K491DRAFT_411974 [Lophiostoma macrostomum CBS 122681]
MCMWCHQRTDLRPAAPRPRPISASVALYVWQITGVPKARRPIFRTRFWYRKSDAGLHVPASRTRLQHLVATRHSRRGQCYKTLARSLCSHVHQRAFFGYP